MDSRDRLHKLWEEGQIPGAQAMDDLVKQLFMLETFRPQVEQAYVCQEDIHYRPGLKEQHTKNKTDSNQLPFVRVTLWPTGPQTVPNIALRNMSNEWRKKQEAEEQNIDLHEEDRFLILYPESTKSAGPVKQGLNPQHDQVYEWALEAFKNFRQPGYDPFLYVATDFNQPSVQLLAQRTYNPP